MSECSFYSLADSRDFRHLDKHWTLSGQDGGIASHALNDHLSKNNSLMNQNLKNLRFLVLSISSQSAVIISDKSSAPTKTKHLQPDLSLFGGPTLWLMG